MECKCKNFKENAEIIDGALISTMLRGDRIKFKPIMYCPWCGKRLETQSD